MSDPCDARSGTSGSSDINSGHSMTSHTDPVSYSFSHSMKRKISQSLDLAKERRRKHRLVLAEPSITAATDSRSSEVYDDEFAAVGPREELLWQNDMIRDDLDVLHSRIHELQQELQRLHAIGVKSTP